MRDNFDHYEQLTKDASGFNNYAADKKRQTKHKPQFDEGEGESITFVGKKNFKINTYYSIIDRLKNELNKKVCIVRGLKKKNSFSNNSCTVGSF